MGKKQEDQTPDGVSRVSHEDKKVKSLSYGGETYELSADGTFLVPNEALAELTSHGFVHVTD